MQLVIDNAEEEIRKLVEDMEKLPIAWRAIHCLWPEAPKYQLEKLTHLLGGVLGEDQSYLFRWGYEDIFIIAKGTRKGPLEMARQDVENFCREGRRIPKDEAFETAFYDLSIDWEEFREFFHFREKEIAKKAVEITSENGELDEKFKSIRREEKNEIRLIHMDFSEKKVELARRALRPGTTILAVDAEEGTLDLLETACKGYKVLKATDGERALERYFDEAPDIVIMDSQLPVISGWEVVRHIYENDPAAFVIMVTAKTDEVDVQRAIRYGIKGIVKKPFNQGKIEQYLARFNDAAPRHKKQQAVK